MKVYRCLNKTGEKLFNMGYIGSRKGSEEERAINLNTHDYGNIKMESDIDKYKAERTHFFLFLEDALDYQKICEESGESYFIGEYEIPDELVINNIGCGFYTDMNAVFVLETAIPYTDLIKESDSQAYEVFTKGFSNCDNITYVSYITRLHGIRKILEEHDLLVPTHIAKISYCNQIIKNGITSDKYSDFISEIGIFDILKALNIEVIMEQDLFDRFDISSRSVNVEEIKEILTKYGLLEKEKVKSI